MPNNTFLVDCPVCGGGGAVQTDKGSYFGPPNEAPCRSCRGVCKVPATRCDVCMGTEAPIVSFEDDLHVCAECKAAADEAERLAS